MIVCCNGHLATKHPSTRVVAKLDPKNSSFQSPKTKINVASGCPWFVLLDDLHRNGFIKDDTIFIQSVNKLNTNTYNLAYDVSVNFVINLHPSP